MAVLKTMAKAIKGRQEVACGLYESVDLDAMISWSFQAMAATAAPQSGFFVTGGTIPPGAPSYVERRADTELFEGLLAGEYCYVLNSRQMGKSSLAIHTIERLAHAGCRTAFVDLTRIGGVSVTVQQWFTGLLVEVSNSLGIRSELPAFLARNASLSPSQRFLAFLQEVALPANPSPLVLFIDEVDAARSLPFSADDLFAGIRQLHNGRASSADLSRLTICLLGAALPADLIRDPRSTPFNVGNRIELRDFTREEALPFAKALGAGGEALLDRVLYWTGGHPYLTQALCAQLAESPISAVDELVRTRYLAGRAKDNDANLGDVATRLLGRGDQVVDDKQRADTLAAYEKLLGGGQVVDDEANPSSARIKMSGLVRVEDGALRIRNRIYERAFDRAWVRDHMPGQELRRQKLAYWRGVARTAAISGAVLTAVTILAVVAVKNAVQTSILERQARTDRDIARYGEYVSTMRNMNELRGQHDLTLISRAIDLHRKDPWRGWEWAFWAHFVHRELRTIDTLKYCTGQFHVSPNGHYGLAADGFGIGVFDIPSGKLVSHSDIGSYNPQWLHDSTRFLASGSDGVLRLYDAATGRILNQRSYSGLLGGAGMGALPGDAKVIMLARDGPVRVAIPSLAISAFPHEKALILSSHQDVSPDGKLVAWHILNGAAHTLTIRSTETGRPVRDIDLGEGFAAIAFAPDGLTVAAGTFAGAVRLFHVSTGQEVCSLKLFNGPISAIYFSSDGRKMSASGKDREGALLAFDGRRMRQIRSLSECGEMEFVPGANEISVPYWNVRLYSADGGPDVPEVRANPDYTSYATFLDNGDLLAADGTTFRRLYITDTGFRQGLIRQSEFALNGGNRLTVERGRLVVRDSRTRKVLTQVEPAAGLPLALSGSGAIATYQGSMIELYVPRTGAHPVLVKPLSEPRDLAFSADSRYAVLSCFDGSITLYRTDTGAKVWSVFDSKRCSIRGFAFSPDGKRLGAASDSDAADVYDVASGKHELSLLGHSQSATCIAWSPDGSRIATGSDDTSIRLWDAKTGADFGIIGRHDLMVVTLSFIHDGRSIASLGLDGVVKLWMTQEQP